MSGGLIITSSRPIDKIHKCGRQTDGRTDINVVAHTALVQRRVVKAARNFRVKSDAVPVAKE